jgi:phage gp36-like protein
MSYCTQAELVERYGTGMLIELTDRADPPANAIDGAVVTRGIDDAGALIDGYLKGRYALPIADTPPLLRDLALAIAIYKMHAGIAGDKIRKDYDDALGVLRAITVGTVRLDVAGAEPAASGATGVRVSDREREITSDNMRDFIA